jgi:hypothetical protein
MGGIRRGHCWSVDCTHAEKHSMFVSWLGAAWMAAVASPVVMLWRE